MTYITRLSNTCIALYSQEFFFIFELSLGKMIHSTQQNFNHILFISNMYLLKSSSHARFSVFSQFALVNHIKNRKNIPVFRRAKYISIFFLCVFLFEQGLDSISAHRRFFFNFMLTNPNDSLSFIQITILNPLFSSWAL